MKEEYKSKILITDFITHNTKRFIISKPRNYNFSEGQATLISIDNQELSSKKRPFSFTNKSDDLVLEFIIKQYSDHNGITKKLHQLKSGDNLIITSPFDSIKYKGAGVFIAGGTGITPFISMLRYLYQTKKISNTKLIYSNKTKKDIILEKEINYIFESNPKNLKYLLTKEKKEGFYDGRINLDLIKSTIGVEDKNFYICGPEKFTINTKNLLSEIGIKSEFIIY